MYHFKYVTLHYTKTINKMENKTVALTFGEAIQALKGGKCVSRYPWNDEYLYLNKGSVDYSEITEIAPSAISAVPYYLFNIGDKDTLTHLPSINFAYATGVFYSGWTPSQHDMLAEDWQIHDRNSIIE